MAIITAFWAASSSPEKISLSALVMLVLHKLRMDLFLSCLFWARRTSFMADLVIGNIYLHTFVYFTTKSRIRIMFINLIPLVPLSFSRRGERGLREGLRPSLTYTPPSLNKGRGTGLPAAQGFGRRGDRLLNDLI